MVISKLFVFIICAIAATASHTDEKLYLRHLGISYKDDSSPGTDEDVILDFLGDWKLISGWVDIDLKRPIAFPGQPSSIIFNFSEYDEDLYSLRIKIHNELIAHITIGENEDGGNVEIEHMHGGSGFSPPILARFEEMLLTYVPTISTINTNRMGILVMSSPSAEFHLGRYA